MIVNEEKKVLVACEYSQVVTVAFRNMGYKAYSCDIIDCEGGHPEWHFKCNVQELLTENWDLIIAHPPCTYLSRVSARWIKNDPGRTIEMGKAREFFMMFTQLNCPTCIENPYPLRAANLPKWTQVICPSDFGHEFTKHTCLWLYDLPPLLPTHCHNINARSWVFNCGGSGKKRARFWEGIAQAMAEQWGPLI